MRPVAPIDCVPNNCELAFSIGKTDKRESILYIYRKATSQYVPLPTSNSLTKTKKETRRSAKIKTKTTMADPKTLINDLSSQVQANDIDSGKATLTKLKVGFFAM